MLDVALFPRGFAGGYKLSNAIRLSAQKIGLTKSVGVSHRFAIFLLERPAKGWVTGLLLLRTGLILLALVCGAVHARAANCVMDAELLPEDRNELIATGGRMTMAILSEDSSTLKSALLPAEASAWDGMREAVEAAAPLVKGGHVELRSAYVLDASMQKAPADTQFFCSNSSGSMTVTITMRELPPGKYAVVLADAAGAPLAGQMAVVLAWDAAASPQGWKLAGLTVRQGAIDGHDGVWYWSRARELAKGGQAWSAWYCYEIARALLIPVEFLSSPNLDKLSQEQGLVKLSSTGASAQDVFPYTIQDTERTWKIDSVQADLSLREADLGVTYDSAGITDPAAQRTEAVAALSAFLKAQPALRTSFHGLWAYAMHDGKRSPVMELPMDKIP
jgi:hypothetical protein